ncbi:MAG: DNA-binding NarL/FixJ family response regulator, partial [Verrucomicrobiales bacterium]
MKPTEARMCVKASFNFETKQCQAPTDASAKKTDNTIHRLLQEGKTSSQIARALNFDPSTISKEIKRNSGGRGYRP